MGFNQHIQSLLMFWDAQGKGLLHLHAVNANKTFSSPYAHDPQDLQSPGTVHILIDSALGLLQPAFLSPSSLTTH